LKPFSCSYSSMATNVDPSFDGYDFSTAGWVTDYLIFMIGVVCGSVVLWLPRKQNARIPSKIEVTFSLFSFVTALTFLFGGIAHMMIGWHAASGVQLGKQWDTEHSGWMFFWLPAVFLMPIAAASNLSFMFAACDLEDWALAVAYAFGLCVGLAEGVLLSDEPLLAYSGLPAALLFLISSSTITVMAGVKAMHNKEKGMGMWMVMAANILFFLGWVIVSFAPSGCRRYSETKRDCPYPNDFNQNAIFHVIIIVAVVTEFFGVKGVADKSERYDFLFTEMALQLPA